jgi:hypothetical protein
MRELTTQELELVAGGLALDSSYNHVFSSVYVAAHASVKGNIATAEANAYGRNTLTETVTTTTPYSSQSSSLSATAGSSYIIW